MERHYIASDIHLGVVPERTERAFLAFLDHVGRNAATLLLPGDLFDFWFEYGEIIHGKHFRVLAALADLVEAGIPVTMVGGNHDAWGGRFLRDEVGIAFSTAPLRIELAGRPALVAHGDGLGSGDLKYRLLKAVIRSRPAVWGFRALHPELGLKLARRVSQTEHKSESEADVQDRARSLEAWGRERLAEDPSLGWVICGHAHLPSVVAVEADRYYLNAGDWVLHSSYITIGPDGQPELHDWTD